MTLWFVVHRAGRAERGRCRHPRHHPGAVADATRRRSSSSTRSSRSSRSARSCCASPAPRRCTRTWATSAAPPIRRAWFVRRVPGADAELPRPGRADPRATRAAMSKPFFLLMPQLGADPHGGAGHRGHGHRVPGGDLRGVLGVPAGGAVGLPAAAARSARPPSTRPARSTCPAVNWALFAGVLVLMLVFRSSERARHGVRDRGHRRAAGRHGAAPRRRPPLLALASLAAGAGRGRVRRDRAVLPRRQPDQGAARRLAAAAHRRRRVRCS